MSSHLASHWNRGSEQLGKGFFLRLIFKHFVKKIVQLLKDQSILPSEIILWILQTFPLENVWILLGENWCCSL